MTSRGTHPISLSLLAAFLLLTLGACASKQRELESVAKDWCLTIRASQVIPVYPMTEDLQPGDVFLVQRTVDDQHRAYTEKGFLPLENHIARLKPTGYAGFYDRSFFLPGEIGQTLPREWLAPGEDHSFKRAPGAAFPAYTISVSSGSGFTAALPIQGVPVGLSLLNASSATGSVTIKEARTYGIDIMSLLSDVQTWEAQESTRNFLGAYALTPDPTRAGPQNYIRVIHRVFLTRKLNVSLNSTQGFAGGASVGVPKPVELPLLDAPQGTDIDQVRESSSDAYKRGLASVTESLNAAATSGGEILPGASLKVVAASARSVSIDETFDSSVVIGYLGFDMAVLPDGRLGPPMPTHAVLERAAVPDGARAAPRLLAAREMHAIGAYRAISEIAKGSDPDAPRAAAIKTQIDQAAVGILPAAYPVPIWSATADNPPQLVDQIARDTPLDPGPNPYRVLVTYLDQLRSSALALALQPSPGSPARADLEATAAEIARIESRASEVAAPLKRAEALLNQ